MRLRTGILDWCVPETPVTIGKPRPRSKLGLVSIPNPWRERDSEMTYIGQAIKRFEDAPLVTGQGSFIGDISLPNMLHAAVLRSDYAHAIIRSVDVSAARNLPGVVAVLTAADVEGVLQDLPSRPMAGERMVEEMNPPSHPLLARDKVCYTGQAVARNQGGKD